VIAGHVRRGPGGDPALQDYLAACPVDLVVDQKRPTDVSAGFGVSSPDV